MDTIEKNSILLADNLKLAEKLVQKGTVAPSDAMLKPAPCTDCAGETAPGKIPVSYPTTEEPTVKSDTYFPIVVNLPSNNGTGTGSTTNQEGQLTEDEKRKRAIIAAAIVLALLVLILVAMAFFSKSNK